MFQGACTVVDNGKRVIFLFFSTLRYQDSAIRDSMNIQRLDFNNTRCSRGCQCAQGLVTRLTCHGDRCEHLYKCMRSTCYVFTGCSGNYGTIDKEAILRVKISRKYGMKYFRRTFRFRQNENIATIS